MRRAPGDLNEDDRVDRHGLNMLRRDLGKQVAESACGAECDLDGNGTITANDQKLMAQLCDSEGCAFAQAEYVGGLSPHEPDMLAVRQADEAADQAVLAAHLEDADLVSSAEAESSGPELHQA